MALIGAEEGLRYLSPYLGLSIGTGAAVYFYPMKIVAAGLALLYFRKDYDELCFRDLLRPAMTAQSILAGLAIFILWINMDWGFARFGPAEAFDPGSIENDTNRALYIATRLFGASVLVPVMEEIFWRSFLLRYIANPDFRGVAIGAWALTPFLAITVLFGLEHNMVAAGLMAGAAYNLLLFRTRSIAQCVIAHSTTNLALGIYVMMTGSWQFW
ncbi:MAG TPA: CAAX prenyl protease-related protein [Deltaproteobacteria bacterium]|nr:CAAX prenyl protease-related protein [Deltaproteobacteria bacterium]HCY09690.1 CAAX prenyl protease-related protein [Deltaproteobacteria bacterium]